jgi:hypothetical protein
MVKVNGGKNVIFNQIKEQGTKTKEQDPLPLPLPIQSPSQRPIVAY